MGHEGLLHDAVCIPGPTNQAYRKTSGPSAWSAGKERTQLLPIHEYVARRAGRAPRMGLFGCLHSPPEPGERSGRGPAGSVGASASGVTEMGRLEEEALLLVVVTYVYLALNERR